MKWITIMVMMVPGLLSAQQPLASLDTSVIRIGEQVTLALSLQWAAGSTVPDVEWPIIGDTLSRQLEVLSVTGPDTTQSEDGMMRMVRRMKITSFDTGFWAIEPFLLTIDGSEAVTQALLLEVRPTPLDEGGLLRDIRGIHEVPFSLWYALGQILPALLGILAVLGLILAIAVAIRRRKSKGDQATEETAPLPLHERIIAELRVIEALHLWQAGDHKGYQARITDLLRGYIEERFQVPALERTTDELLRELRLSSMPGDQRTGLGNMLRLADLVKFAKATPSPVENERLMTEAIRFVQATAVGDRTGPASLDGQRTTVVSQVIPDDHAN